MMREINFHHVWRKKNLKIDYFIEQCLETDTQVGDTLQISGKRTNYINFFQVKLTYDRFILVWSGLSLELRSLRV